MSRKKMKSPTSYLIKSKIYRFLSKHYSDSIALLIFFIDVTLDCGYKKLKKKRNQKIHSLKKVFYKFLNIKPKMFHSNQISVFIIYYNNILSEERKLF